MNKNEITQTAKLLAMMFNAFPQSSMADVDAQMEAYLFCVEGYHFQDVSAAIKRIMQGGEGHERRSFAPSTAELCAEIERRQEMRAIMERRAERIKLAAIDGGKQ